MKNVYVAWASCLIVVIMISLCCGCVMILNYAPAAQKASLYTHEQSATNMSITEDISGQLAKELTGVLGANVRVQDNTIKGIDNEVHK